MSIADLTSPAHLTVILLDGQGLLFHALSVLGIEPVADGRDT